MSPDLFAYEIVEEKPKEGIPQAKIIKFFSHDYPTCYIGSWTHIVNLRNRNYQRFFNGQFKTGYVYKI